MAIPLIFSTPGQRMPINEPHIVSNIAPSIVPGMVWQYDRITCLDIAYKRYELSFTPAHHYSSALFCVGCVASCRCEFCTCVSCVCACVSLVVSSFLYWLIYLFIAVVIVIVIVICTVAVHVGALWWASVDYWRSMTLHVYQVLHDVSAYSCT